jgi:hypothetical protein
MSGHRAAGFTVVTENHSSLCAAEPYGGTQERIEHRLQIEGRATDDLEDVGGGSLLLKGFAEVIGTLPQFLEQPCVLDSDDRLVGEILDQLDLLVGERPDFLAVNDNRADQLVFLEHRHEQHGPYAGEVDQGEDARVALDVAALRL